MLVSVYAYLSNRPSIEISDLYTDQLDNENEPIKFGFVLANVSPKTITVKEINLLDSSNKKLENIHVQVPEDDWKKYPNPFASPYSCSPLLKMKSLYLMQKSNFLII